VVDLFTAMLVYHRTDRPNHATKRSFRFCTRRHGTIRARWIKSHPAQD
jgi:hypothetical protein